MIAQCNRIIDLATKRCYSDRREPYFRVTVTDWRATRWPDGLTLGDEALAEHLDAWNDELPGRAARQAAKVPAARRPLVEPLASWRDARAEADAVLSFSHFLPRIELIPEKRYLVYPDLIKARRRMSHP